MRPIIHLIGIHPISRRLVRSIGVCVLALLLAALAVPAAREARALEHVDLALVLVSDVSRSIDDIEFELEKQGYVTALTDPRVLNAIHNGALGAIALAYVEFAGAYEVRTVIGWTDIHDAASAQRFVDRLKAEGRSFWGRTAISSGIDHAVQLLAESRTQAGRRVIDVCADGANNAGRDVTEARDAALAAGITINGLTIVNDRPVAGTLAHVQPPGGLTKYFRENVIGGPASFVLEVRDFHSFGEAMTRKLVSEIAGVEPENLRDAGPRLTER